MKWRKIVLPPLIGLAVAVGPVFLPDSPRALAAQVKRGPSARPAAKAKTAAKPQAAVKPKTAKNAKTVKKARPSDNLLLCRSHATVRVPEENHTYLVKNDNFMDLGECLSGSYTAPAFRVAESRATATGPGSDAMPNIYTGCAWGRCSPDTHLPAKVSRVGNTVTTFHTTERAKGTWAASYDLWFDPRPLRNGQAATEMMIWLDGQNIYNPAGHGWNGGTGLATTAFSVQ